PRGRGRAPSRPLRDGPPACLHGLEARRAPRQGADAQRQGPIGRGTPQGPISLANVLKQEVPGVGFEPTCPKGPRILSPLPRPVWPPRRGFSRAEACPPALGRDRERVVLERLG